MSISRQDFDACMQHMQSVSKVYHVILQVLFIVAYVIATAMMARYRVFRSLHSGLLIFITTAVYLVVVCDFFVGLFKVISSRVRFALRLLRNCLLLILLPISVTLMPKAPQIQRWVVFATLVIVVETVLLFVNLYFMRAFLNAGWFSPPAVVLGEPVKEWIQPLLQPERKLSITQLYEVLTFQHLFGDDSQDDYQIMSASTALPTEPELHYSSTLQLLRGAVMTSCLATARGNNDEWPGCVRARSVDLENVSAKLTEALRAYEASGSGPLTQNERNVAEESIRELAANRDANEEDLVLSLLPFLPDHAGVDFMLFDINGQTVTIKSNWSEQQQQQQASSSAMSKPMGLFLRLRHVDPTRIWILFPRVSQTSEDQDWLARLLDHIETIKSTPQTDIKFHYRNTMQLLRTPKLQTRRRVSVTAL